MSLVGFISVELPPPPTGLLLIAFTTSLSLFAVDVVFASTAALTLFVAAVFASTAVLP